MTARTTVSILEGDTFVVSDLAGDIDASPTEPHGLFSSDTRFLSRWRLTLDGKPLGALSTDDLEYFSAQFFLVPDTGTVYVNATLSIVRKRSVNHGFRETITVLNHASTPRELTLRLEAASDFADLFEVKDATPKKGDPYQRVDGQRLVLGYRRERFVRETWIDPKPTAQVDPGGFTFVVRLDAHAEWTASFDVTAVDLLQQMHAKTNGGSLLATQREGLVAWRANAPQLTSSWPELERAYARSLVDLAALRFFPGLAPQSALPAAGLPWFMAVFGRDSLITSYQALPFVPELARTSLLVLGLRQGVHVDDFRDEEPGKILHEARWGELTAFEERPHSPYFGAADSTPLFLVLLDEYVRWSGDVRLAVELQRQARAALAWIDTYGDRDGDGYVEYDRRNKETGLENQCWKDSGDSIAFADGRLAERPIATCEIQGYVYDAKKRCARLAREVWNDAAFAARLDEEAETLKRRFNADFWIADRRFFALALDGKKQKVDSLTSNIGHLLWSGIVDDDKADAIVAHLMSDRLFSGWGIRTMATSEGAYNPIGYHVGTVWPHDCSIIGMGLRRYGRKREASRLAKALIEAAAYFDYRLPEAFAGYPRAMTEFPVEYPTACSPQAWASGAPLLMLRVLLGLEPVQGRLLVDPAIPQAVAHIGLLSVPGQWGRADAFGRGRIELGPSEEVRAPL
jgi:glycogen debranching enzyme